MIDMKPSEAIKLDEVPLTVTRALYYLAEPVPSRYFFSEELMLVLEDVKIPPSLVKEW